jgi:integrase
MLAILRAILNWGIKRGYLHDNPAVRVERAVVKPPEVQIWTPDEVARLLQDCMENDLELLPYRVFTVWCGIRPCGEISRIDWQDVNLTDCEVRLRAGITKKGRPRHPRISPNAMQWLQAYRDRKALQGRVMPWTQGVLDSKCRANCRRASVKNIKNGGRHSYISYHIAIGTELSDLTAQSGHKDIRTVWAHYYGAATRAEGERFWSIVP